MNRKTAMGVVSAVILSVVGLSLAADVPFQHVTVDSRVKDPWAKIIADIDRDGFPDLVVGGQAGPLVWYRYPDWTQGEIAQGGYRTVDGEAGDIDGDGDLDVVMGGVIWYENPLPKGNPAPAQWTAHTVADHRTHDVELADLDKDGKLDIVTRDQSDFGHKAGDKIYLWRREAADRWVHKIVACPHGEGLALADMDRDGDADIVIGGIWFENDGRLLEGAWQSHKFGDWHPSAGVEVADINGDGRPDVVLSPSELKGNWHRLSWFEAPADPRQGSWTEHQIVERIECVIHGLATGDFNGDGTVDIASSEMHQGDDPDDVVVFLNRGNGAAWDKQILSTKGSHCIQAGDIGADGDLDLLGANWSGPYQPVELWENQSGPRAVQSKGNQYHVPALVGAAGFARAARPVEVPLDFGRLLERLGQTSPGGVPRIRVWQVDAATQTAREVAPVQFDRDPQDGPAASLRGTLTFLLPEPMAPGDERVYHIGFDFEDAPPATGKADSLVTVTETAEHEGQKSFKIVTPQATWYYHQQGAGFASLEDQDGHDWLSYNPGDGPVSKSGSGGKYRGLPNMVHPEGNFHPGNEQCTSRLLAAGPVRAVIASESADGKWACRWDIFPAYARQTVLKADHAYWFLYEGTPGGKLEEDADYCVRADGTRTPASARWEGDIQARGETAEWLYFGDSAMQRVLYLVHEEDDDAIDSYWPMNREMTVFGFGRKGLNKYMTPVPAHFLVGFCEKANFAEVSQAVQSACRPLTITLGEPKAGT
ncbi:MAG: VCBS repeat-containing protein [Planctomycetes bacterium]|jgi:hypothetical protein|nr:VCBS repeat-containing protein [Planctomycetota bacterium]